MKLPPPPSQQHHPPVSRSMHVPPNSPGPPRVRGEREPSRNRLMSPGSLPSSRGGAASSGMQAGSSAARSQLSPGPPSTMQRHPPLSPVRSGEIANPFETTQHVSMPMTGAEDPYRFGRPDLYRGQPATARGPGTPLRSNSRIDPSLLQTPTSPQSQHQPMMFASQSRLQSQATPVPHRTVVRQISGPGSGPAPPSPTMGGAVITSSGRHISTTSTTINHISSPAIPQVYSVPQAIIPPTRPGITVTSMSSFQEPNGVRRRSASPPGFGPISPSSPRMQEVRSPLSPAIVHRR